jgi:hypothetical protein
LSFAGADFFLPQKALHHWVSGDIRQNLDSIAQLILHPSELRADPIMISQTLKEELIREKLNLLGFELERDDFGWIIRDRREQLDMPDMPALKPIKFPHLDSILDLFKIRL